eukprot:c20763_g3_i5.p1 GENE.c20763_g3_i5~~c20763_g3_i5.p1  ORF type:complete len:661 (-),score=26.21 c20763_g3_i5:155-1882(-)
MSNLTLQDQNIQTILNNGAVPPLVNHLKNPDANIQLQAAWALSNLMVSEQGRALALQHQACPPLVAMLTHSLAPLQERAIIGIANMALDEAPRAVLASLNAHGPLCNVLSNPDKKFQENGAWALGNLLANESVQVFVGQNSSACSNLIRMLGDSSVDVVERAIRAVANIALLESNGPKLRDLGAISGVVRLLSHSDNDIKFHASRALNNLAIADGNETAITQAGAVPILVGFLSASNENLVDQSIQALANLCMGLAAASTVRQSGGVPNICKLLNSSNVRMKLNSARTVSNLARDADAAEQVRSNGGITGLTKLLNEQDVIKQVSLQALANLASASDANKRAIATEPGCGQTVAQMINSPIPAISGMAATVAAYVTIDSSEPTQDAWRGAGIYEACIKACQTHSDPNTKLQACSCLANSAANDKNMATLGDKGAISAFIKLLSDGEPAIRQNAAVGLMNYSGGVENQCQMRGNFGALVAALQSSNDATKAQLCKACINLAADEPCRDAVRNSGGLPVLINLLSSPDQDVSSSAALALYNISFTKANKDEMKKLGAREKAMALGGESGNKLADLLK